MRDVSIIIINYNSAAYTKECVESIRKFTPAGINYEIIIVDNNSRIDDYGILKESLNAEGIKIIRSRINLGFAGGNTFGIQFADSKYYFFVNNDCLFLNDALTPLLDFCGHNPKAGICAPQLFTESMERHSTFDYFPVLSTKLLGIKLASALSGKRYLQKNIIYELPVEADLVSGSAMFVNAEAFGNIGGFDLNYFLYCEEEDLALRMHKSGYKVYVVPASRVQHLGGKSSEENFDIRKEFYISFLYFYLKHYGWIKTQILKLYLFIKLIKKVKNPINTKLAFFVIKGAPLAESLRHKQRISKA
jgi:GT2 family glycosyltransferase